MAAGWARKGKSSRLFLPMCLSSLLPDGPQQSNKIRESSGEDKNLPQNWKTVKFIRTEPISMWHVSLPWCSNIQKLPRHKASFEFHLELYFCDPWSGNLGIFRELNPVVKSGRRGSWWIENNGKLCPSIETGFRGTSTLAFPPPISVHAARERLWKDRRFTFVGEVWTHLLYVGIWPVPSGPDNPFILRTLSRSSSAPPFF